MTRMASPSALYASATAGRDLLPLPKYTLPAQKGGGRSKGAKMTAAQKRQAARLRKSLLSVHDGGAGNRDDSQGPSSSSSSSTSSSLLMLEVVRRQEGVVHRTIDVN